MPDVPDKVFLGSKPCCVNGAVLLGLNGTVVKSHGNVDGVAFSHALDTARLAAKKDLVGHIRHDLEASRATLTQADLS